MSIAAIIIGMVFAKVFSQRIVITPLQHIKDVVQQVQQTGNLQLRVKLKGQDEMAVTGQAFNSMMQSFKELVTKIDSSTEELFAAAEQLDQNSNILLDQSNPQQCMTSQLAPPLQ